MAKETPHVNSDLVANAEQQSSPVISGLDMRPTIDWYTAHQHDLSQRIPVDNATVSPFALQDTTHFHVSPDEVNGLIRLFPDQSLRRSRLQTGAIIGKSSLYFRADATPAAITTTPDAALALSPTAIIPSYTDNARWRETGNLSSDIWLFALPSSLPESVRKIIHAEGLLHEVAHTVVSQALYKGGYRLRLPGGKIISGEEFMINFAAAAEKHEPVSHYASFYRKDGEEFKNSVSIDEEFVETVAAKLLGFAYSDNPDRRMNPLGDRPEIVDMIDTFLNAEEVKTS